MTVAADAAASSADGVALAHLRRSDPVLARVIDAHADFDARGWLRDLPPMDAFGALIFMVTGQQLSVRSATRILGRLADLFGGELPSPAQLLGLGPPLTCSQPAFPGARRRRCAPLPPSSPTARSARTGCGGCPMRRYSTSSPRYPASARGRCRDS